MAQSFPHSQYAVLVVEDEPLIRIEAADIVREAGFVAYEARNADEAIRMMEQHSKIRILFSDIEMPGSIDGLKLARAVHDRWPPVHIILVSGRIKVRASDMPDHSVFFSKPYDPTDILRTLSRFGGRIEG